MGPSSHGTPTLASASPRPGGQFSARPTSELLGTMFQTPEGTYIAASVDSPAYRFADSYMFCYPAEALNLQSYEATLVCSCDDVDCSILNFPCRRIWMSTLKTN
jgi:hypothetical protein